VSRAQPPWSIARARRCSVAAGVRRFVAYLSERQGTPEPHVDAAAASEYLTHLAVRRQVSASTQNQALCAILFDYHVAWYAPSGSMLTIPRTRGRTARPRDRRWPSAPHRTARRCGPAARGLGSILGAGTTVLVGEAASALAVKRQALAEPLSAEHTTPARARPGAPRSRKSCHMVVRNARCRSRCTGANGRGPTVVSD
jgi:hypothetical protein